MTHIVGAVHQAHTRETKISQLDMAIAGYQQIVWLQVSMDDSLHDSKKITQTSDACFRTKQGHERHACGYGARMGVDDRCR